MKNLMTINLISLGTPMILMGDEIGRSQKGNNNGYCQDTPDFWFNWQDIDKNKELLRFTRELIKQRDILEVVCFDHTYRLSLHDIIHQAEIRWHGAKLNKPDWGPNSHAIALQTTHLPCDIVSYMIFNAYEHAVSFELPVSPNGKWLRAVDTSLTNGADIYTAEDKKKWVNNEYIAASRSVVILIGYLTRD
jgi:glycogen operon protein